MTNDATPLIGVIMGSKSDWETMREAAQTLAQFGVAHECRVVSAHRTPEWMVEYATQAEGRGLEVIIAGAGGAAHLPGMVAGHTLLPVIGVPIQSKALNALDRADAGWCTRRHDGDRSRRGHQCRPARRRHSGQ